MLADTGTLQQCPELETFPRKAQRWFPGWLRKSSFSRRQRLHTGAGSAQLSAGWAAWLITDRPLTLQCCSRSICSSSSCRLPSISVCLFLFSLKIKRERDCKRGWVLAPGNLKAGRQQQQQQQHTSVQTLAEMLGIHALSPAPPSLGVLQTAAFLEHVCCGLSEWEQFSSLS